MRKKNPRRRVFSFEVIVRKSIRTRIKSAARRSNLNPWQPVREWKAYFSGCFLQGDCLVVAIAAFDDRIEKPGRVLILPGNAQFLC